MWVYVNVRGENIRHTFNVHEQNWQTWKKRKQSHRTQLNWISSAGERESERDKEWNEENPVISFSSIVNVDKLNVKQK